MSNGKTTPQSARTDAEMSSLRRDNVSTEGFGFLVHDRHVTIFEQREGEEATNQISVPKNDFDVFVKMYVEG